MTSLRPKVLSLSRSYLSHLVPRLATQHPDAEYLHIVQNNEEAARIAKAGGTVVLNIANVIANEFARPIPSNWAEPSGFRELTGFPWCPMQADRYLIHMDTPNRFRVAGALQLAISDLFKKHRFDVFLSEPVALFVTHLVFYHCKLHGVKTLLWCSTYYPKEMYFSDSIYFSSANRKSERPKWELNAVEKEVVKYVEGVSSDSAGPVYHYAFSKQKEDSIGYFKQRRGESPLILSGKFMSTALQFLRVLRSIILRCSFPFHGDYMGAFAVKEHWFYFRCALSRNKLLDSMPTEFSADNVVYPLQYEPEASLLYLAPHINSQACFVESVLKALPAGKTLWVKEHPNQAGALSQSVWRKLRSRHQNVRFIGGRKSGRELIRKSSLIVTISSSMGLDGLILGRKVVVAGDVFYKNFRGSIPVASVSALAVALNESSSYSLVAEAATRAAADIIGFARLAYRGDPQPAADLYAEANIANLANSIASEMV